ncbi:MAG: 4-hydroxy-tetrahydrodipicolinate reductase [Candidatus Eiseniibacteriota bacterium]|jgi:4-hydroxy-tetrahydrodipicolinate reductase
MAVTPIPVCVAGAAGRMGHGIATAVLAAVDLELVGLLVEADDPRAGRPLAGLDTPLAATADLEALLAPGRVLVDFTAPAATATLVTAAARHACPFVSGATALAAADQAALEQAARSIPVLHAPNMSRGIEVLGQLLARAAAVLEDFDLEIVERHHRRKADAPSGTALRLAGIAARARRQGEPTLEHGRAGRTDGGRRDGTIGVHALRGGDWVGEHDVLLAGPGETLELRHRAESRAVFAAGTLACVRFVAVAAPGRYGMADVLQV